MDRKFSLNTQNTYLNLDYMPISPVAINVNLQSVLQYLLHRGLTTDAILEALEFSADTRIDTLTSIPLESVLKLINRASETLQDKTLGLRLATVFSLEDWGPLNMGQIVFSYASNIREAFSLSDQLYPLISPGLQMKLEEDAAVSKFSARIILPVSIDSCQFYEFATAWTVILLRSFIGEDWSPSQVNFTHAKAADDKLYQELLGNNIQYEQPSNGFSFENHYLDTRVSKADPQLLKESREKLLTLLEAAQLENSVLSKVRYYMLLTLKQQACHAQPIAQLMCMSERTLSRRLKELGTNFQKVKEDIIIEITKTALAQTQATISDIAIELGFSEVSVLTRAFKKSTGLSPKQYRVSSNQ